MHDDVIVTVEGGGIPMKMTPSSTIEIALSCAMEMTLSCTLVIFRSYLLLSQAVKYRRVPNLYVEINIFQTFSDLKSFNRKMDGRETEVERSGSEATIHLEYQSSTAKSVFIVLLQQESAIFVLSTLTSTPTAHCMIVALLW